MDTRNKNRRQAEDSVVSGRNGREAYRSLRFLVATSCRCSWRFAKNCIRLLTGRNTRFDENALFLRQYFLHLTGIRPIRKLTCTGLVNTEGAGSQALMVMDAINFARYFDLAYVHTPFRLIQHADRPMKEWAAAWEALFNLGAGEIVCDAKRDHAVNFCYAFHELDRCFPWYGRVHELAESFRAMIPEFKHKYHLNKPPRVRDEVVVAVHVRRGDVTPENADYFTPNEKVLRTMTGVKSILEARHVNYKMCVYSQGATAEFAELALPGIEFALNADALWAMQELIAADILIMGKGCFSYCAGLFSDGIKIFEAGTPTADDFLPGWKWQYFPATENWIQCETDGCFNVAAFEKLLLATIRTKTTVAAKKNSAS